MPNIALFLHREYLSYRALKLVEEYGFKYVNFEVSPSNTNIKFALAKVFFHGVHYASTM